MALFLYKLLTLLTLPIVLSGFWVRSLRQRAYRQRLLERLGHNKGLMSDGIVIHGASVGEITSLKPFIESLLITYPNLPVTVTSFTPTGSDRIIAQFSKRVQHCYIPLDTPLAVHRFLTVLQPKVLVLMETELWPVLIDQCHRKGVKILLINGRISKRSFPRYQKISGLIKTTLKKIDRILTQSDEDAQHFEALGANKSKLHVSGNLKYDLSASETIHDQALNILNQLHDRMIWVVGSSHADEEKMILSSFSRLLETFPNALLVIAPRHPERVEHLQTWLTAAKMKFVKRSESSLPCLDCQVWLIDTMGEMLLFYRLADVCTIAGSFGATGGHNPLEAALFSKPIVVGPNMENFRDVTARLLDADGLIQLPSSSAELLAEAVKRLCEDKAAATALGENTQKVLSANQGATKKSLTALQELMSDFDPRG